MSSLPSIVLRKPVEFTKSQQAIQLLRRLYRETSCLFDEVGRQQIKTRIRERFRECQEVIDEQRRTKLLKDGRRILSTLTRANNGDKWRTLYVLEHAYGRRGKIKHQILKPLLKEVIPEPPIIPSRIRSATPGLTPKLAALFKGAVGKTIKLTEPEIPEFSVSGKPFPRNRIANMKWRHRSMILKRIAPPLEPVDFERLEMLVMGWKQTIPPKRKFITRETRAGPKVQRPNMYNGRMQRRILKHVLEQFPMLEYRPASEKFVATYSPVLTTMLHTPGDPEDFEGVDEKGEPEGTILNPNRALSGKLAVRKKRAKGKATAFSNWLDKKTEEGKVPENVIGG
ncbi:hypothetical protein TWF730_010899 [Orbilia blumenaviensis]|uniref:LYR motif-containing protein Cup1-like N-terminal domain-containing protein n=1 Tax=Orbilia blumenaviensis TaxID=1796055 RepID=A0AAV9UNB8_9PEZI